MMAQILAYIVVIGGFLGVMTLIAWLDLCVKKRITTDALEEFYRKKK